MAKDSLTPVARRYLAWLQCTGLAEERRASVVAAGTAVAAATRLLYFPSSRGVGQEARPSLECRNTRRCRRGVPIPTLPFHARLKNEHDTLKDRVQSAVEDSTTHAVRLQIELDQMTAMLSSADHSLHKLLQQKENLAQQLIMRERQLALCVTHIEGGRTEMDMPRTHRMDEVANLRNVLAEREQHTVLLIRDLYELASAERAPGVVAHNIRSRIFLRCASIYEQLGEKAFDKDADATKANAMHVQDRAADSSARSVSR